MAHLLLFIHRYTSFSISGKSKSGTLVPNDAKQQMIALQSKSESKKVNAEELVLGFNKFHKHWVEQLESVRSRKP